MAKSNADEYFSVLCKIYHSKVSPYLSTVLSSVFGAKMTFYFLFILCLASNTEFKSYMQSCVLFLPMMTLYYILII